MIAGMEDIEKRKTMSVYLCHSEPTWWGKTEVVIHLCEFSRTNFLVPAVLIRITE